MIQVAALFTRADSVYRTIPGVDCWDIERDARNFPGGMPVVAHPPCRAWGQLSHLANPRPDEKDLARFAVRMVRKNGGVLEHPAGSRLWPDQGFPTGRATDKHGGWTLGIDQFTFGHPAQKNTRLYIVGCSPREIPEIPIRLGEPWKRVTTRAGMIGRRCTNVEREATPPALALWLVELARRCNVGSEVVA